MLITYYPKYSTLDEIINLTTYDTINFFIDLKNCSQALYINNHNIELMIENTKMEKRIDSSLLTDLLSFLTFHKIYGMKRNKKINFFIFYETGQSFFHKNIYKYYKINRKIDALSGLDKESRELFTIIMQKNFSLIETALNVVPNIWVIKLENLEADFIPYFLINENLIDTNAYNIIYSNDHDMFQILELGDNIFQYRKIRNNRYILKKGDANKTFLKRETNIPDSFFPLVMAIVGDKSDCIEGLSGIGLSRVNDVILTFLEQNINMTEIYKNILKTDKLGLDVNTIQAQNKLKIDEDIIVRNLKLISFEFLSMILNDPPNTEYLEKRKKIIKKINDKKIASIDTLKNALNRSKINLREGNELEILFS